MTSTEDEEKDALSLETESVHQVYDIIAGHFSETRYKVLASLSVNVLTTAMAPCREFSKGTSRWVRRV